MRRPPRRASPVSQRAGSYSRSDLKQTTGTRFKNDDDVDDDDDELDLSHRPNTGETLKQQQHYKNKTNRIRNNL